MDYRKALDIQNETHSQVLNKIDLESVLIVEHPDVITLGKRGGVVLEGNHRDIPIIQTDRGGLATCHNFGQLVVYPILDLEQFFTDIHKYMRFLEQVVINTLSHFKIDSGRVEGMTGVWIDYSKNKPRKICAMGVKSSRWVTMHGIGFNINSEI